MSRQNPNILDEMYTPPPPNQDTGIGKEVRWDNGDVGNNEETRKSSHLSRRLKDFSMSPGLGGGTGSLSQNSYLRQVLKQRSRSSSPSSLVQLATRKNAGGLLKKGIGRSPVTVRLAGVRKEEGQPEVKGVSAEERTNPCDKEVVLSALRQKRYIGGGEGGHCSIIEVHWRGEGGIVV
jgi:hypothetical protein